MLPGADLVVYLEDVEVLLGAEVEHPQIAGRHEADKVVRSVVGRNDESRRSVSLSECADERGPGVPGTEGARLWIEAGARLGKAAPVPVGGSGRVHAPDPAAGRNRSTAQADRPVIGEGGEIAGGKLRHRARSASATRFRRSWVYAAPRRSRCYQVRYV